MQPPHPGVGDCGPNPESVYQMCRDGGFVGRAGLVGRRQKRFQTGCPCGDDLHGCSVSDLHLSVGEAII